MMVLDSDEYDFEYVLTWQNFFLLYSHVQLQGTAVLGTHLVQRMEKCTFCMFCMSVLLQTMITKYRHEGTMSTNVQIG